MDDESDPYEQQLFAVFKSCDSSDTGILDKSDFTKLCDILQLGENHRSLLTTRLCNNGKCSINFSQFRDALLAVLASLKTANDDFDSENTEKETTPKFVFGRKKYGRRSRPASTDLEEEFDKPTPTNEDTFVFENLFSVESTTKPDCKGKLSNSKVRTIKSDVNDLEIETLCQHLGVHENTIITNQKLMSICNSLGISNSVHDMIQENLTKLKTCNLSNDVDNKTEITYRQFFQLIKTLGCVKDSASIRISNSAIIKTAPFSEDGISSVDINASGCISYDTLVCLLENAGVSDVGIFLNDLGISPLFDVNLSELAAQLQEELLNMQRCMDDSSSQLYTVLNPHLLLLQASVVVSQAQIKWYKSCMEQMQCERDKLRNDLLVANERASLVAQEVDDNHAKMENSVKKKLKLLEQKHTDQIKKLTQQWSVEREQLTNQNLKMEKQLEQFLYDETKLRLQVASLKQDYENLEKENRNLLDQLVNAENTRGGLELEVQRLSLLKKKVLELESSNEQAISFLEKMNQLQADNIALRDKNDELAVELENVTLRQMQSRSSCSKRRGNFPSEGDENSDTDVAAIVTNRMFPKVRKYSTERDLSVGIDGPHSETLNSTLITHCESGVEADISTSSSSLERFGETFAQINEKMIIELKSRVTFLENFIRKCQLKVPYSNDDVDFNDKSSDRSAEDLEKQCETLQQRLDQVQKEILKILSEKRACTEENCVLKMKISELMKHLPAIDITNNVKYSVDTSVNSSLETVKGEPTLSYRIYPNDKKSNTSIFTDLNVTEKRILEDSEALLFVENESRISKACDSLMVEKNTPEKNSVLTQIINTSRSSMFAPGSEEESEMEWKTIGEERKSSISSSKMNENIDLKADHHYEQLLEGYNQLSEENKTLSSKCEELESCLDMLRNEYDQCEEYWASKLDEERKLFEEEQKISDEKFAELRLKIEEYSEMFDAESMSSQMLSKLPPIAENEKWEKEVNDLQEEFKEYKERMELENKEKQNEIDRLMRIVSLYEKSGNFHIQQSSFGQNSLKLPNQSIEQSLESIRSDKTYILENPSLNPQDIPCVEEVSGKFQNSKLTELKVRKKRLKKDCDKLEREKDNLMEDLIRIRSESRIAYNFAPCRHAIQQHHAEVSTSGILLRLRHQEIKNRHLRNVLLQLQKKLNTTKRETLEQHEEELTKYRIALSSSHKMWQSLQDITKNQAEQIAKSDILVKELYCENSKLIATVHQLEQNSDYPTPVLL